MSYCIVIDGDCPAGNNAVLCAHTICPEKKEEENVE